MEESSLELAAFVALVRGATGRGQGRQSSAHSEGSLMPDYYVKFRAATSTSTSYVAMTPLWTAPTPRRWPDANQAAVGIGLGPASDRVPAAVRVPAGVPARLVRSEELASTAARRSTGTYTTIMT